MKRFQMWHSSSVRGVPWACAQLQDRFVGLAGEGALPDLGVSDAEEPAAASIEGNELRLAEILHVIRRELTGGVQANLVEHPPEIDQAADFIVATAQAGNVWHERNDNQPRAGRESRISSGDEAAAGSSVPASVNVLTHDLSDPAPALHLAPCTLRRAVVICPVVVSPYVIHV